MHCVRERQRAASWVPSDRKIAAMIQRIAVKMSKHLTMQEDQQMDSGFRQTAQGHS